MTKLIAIEEHLSPLISVLPRQHLLSDKRVQADLIGVKSRGVSTTWESTG